MVRPKVFWKVDHRFENNGVGKAPHPDAQEEFVCIARSSPALLVTGAEVVA